MTLNQYQYHAMSTCLPSSKNHVYAINGLTAEVGELNDKVAKAVRKGWIKIQDNHIVTLDSCPENFWTEFYKELGDVAWFVACLCSVGNVPLEKLCQDNVKKLASRQQRGVIDGNGDNR